MKRAKTEKGTALWLVSRELAVLRWLVRTMYQVLSVSSSTPANPQPCLLCRIESCARHNNCETLHTVSQDHFSSPVAHRDKVRLLF
jgi:hypothetical protein